MQERQPLEDVKKLRESLGQLPEALVRPFFIVVSGLPGTGKSHLSRKLAEKLSAVILGSDALRKVLFPSPAYDHGENQRLFQACHLLVAELLRRGIPLILDATNLEERHRERLYSIAEHLKAKLILVWVEAPPEVVRQRLASRLQEADPEGKSDAGWTVYQKMRGSVDNMARHHFVVDTSRDISPVIEKIVREASR